MPGSRFTQNADGTVSRNVTGALGGGGTGGGITQAQLDAATAPLQASIATLQTANTANQTAIAANQTANQAAVTAARNFAGPSSRAFSTSIEFSGSPIVYAQQAVSGPLAFTVAANPVEGASAVLRLVADGTNTPDFSAFTQITGSSGWDNRNGILNLVYLQTLGGVTYSSFSQILTATPTPPPPPPPPPPGTTTPLTFSRRTSSVFSTGNTLGGVGPSTSNYAIADFVMPGDGSYEVAFVSRNAMIGVSTQNALVNYGGFTAFMWAALSPTVYYGGNNGTNIAPLGVQAAAGDSYRITRTGNAIKGQVRRTGQSNWIDAITFSLTSTQPLYLHASFDNTDFTTPANSSFSNPVGTGVVPI